MSEVSIGIFGALAYFASQTSASFGVHISWQIRALIAYAIVGYFLRHRQGESAWASIIAPALGGIGLVTGIALMIINYSTLAGSTATWVNSLPWLLPVAAVTGAVRAGRQPAHEPSDDDHAQTASTTDRAVTAPSGTAASV
jgi:NADH:ubiquinone oxidoreductase subunit 5 (subunit L)/multisubunit Na+/H+ antiporter MnhA subunit